MTAAQHIKADARHLANLHSTRLELLVTWPCNVHMLVVLDPCCVISYLLAPHKHVLNLIIDAVAGVPSHSFTDRSHAVESLGRVVRLDETTIDVCAKELEVPLFGHLCLDCLSIPKDLLLFNLNHKPIGGLALLLVKTES